MGYQSNVHIYAVNTNESDKNSNNKHAACFNNSLFGNGSMYLSPLIFPAKLCLWNFMYTVVALNAINQEWFFYILILQKQY